MSQFLIIAVSALAGAALFGVLAETNMLLGLAMGAIFGATAALAISACPVDLDYRERRVWPPRER